MKPPREVYNKIPALPSFGVPFIHIPGCYCRRCGAVMALYSYSLLWPDGLDEEGKPYYGSCPDCPPRTFVIDTDYIQLLLS